MRLQRLPLSSFANKILNSDSQNVIDEAFKFNGSDTELKADEIEKDKNKLTLLRKLLGSKEICPVNILYTVILELVNQVS